MPEGGGFSLTALGKVLRRPVPRAGGSDGRATAPLRCLVFGLGRRDSGRYAVPAGRLSRLAGGAGLVDQGWRERHVFSAFAERETDNREGGRGESRGSEMFLCATRMPSSLSMRADRVVSFEVAFLITTNYEGRGGQIRCVEEEVAKTSSLNVNSHVCDASPSPPLTGVYTRRSSSDSSCASSRPVMTFRPVGIPAAEGEVWAKPKAIPIRCPGCWGQLCSRVRGDGAACFRSIFSRLLLLRAEQALRLDAISRPTSMGEKRVGECSGCQAVPALVGGRKVPHGERRRDEGEVQIRNCETSLARIAALHPRRGGGVCVAAASPPLGLFGHARSARVCVVVASRAYTMGVSRSRRCHGDILPTSAA